MSVPAVEHKEVTDVVNRYWNNDFDSATSALESKKGTHPRYSVEWAFLHLIRDLMRSDTSSKETALTLFQNADRLAFAQRNGQGATAAEAPPPDEDEPDDADQTAILEAAAEDGENEKKSSSSKFLQRGWKALGSIGSMGAQAIKTATGKANKLPEDPAALNWKLECDVIYADAMLVRSICQLRMNAYLKGAVNIRKTWGYYQSLLKALELRGSDINDVVRDNIKYGVGVFYVFLTLVPSGLMKVLSAIGFIRDSELGEQYLMQVFDNGGVRAPFAALVLLTYYLFIPTGLADVSDTLRKAKALLDRTNATYPSNSYFNGYTNFYHRKRGEPEEGLIAIGKAIENSHTGSPVLLRYLQADTLFMAMRWKEAVEAYESLWSDIKTQDLPFEYSGQLVMTMAAGYMMLGDEPKAKDYMQQVPAVTNPRSKQDANSPKFANRCINESRMLPLAGFHCLYINRDMAHMSKESLLQLEECLVAMEEKHKMSEVPECEAMRLLFQGVIQKVTGRIPEARASWEKITSMEKMIGTESPTLPYGYYELGELEYRQGNLKESKKYFDYGVKLKGEKNDTLTNRYNRAISHLNKAIKEAK
eukprot:TRINITY_DN5994_c0_g1_i1.p1 TRINITY_DN5994_c0_g1~~TRINITY_DN5994_c0_g1_i1.p1  ORF type:complete len:590 (+),score=113.24 TRINITY_DN5994_c0_g1_i1:409-2178(+)